MPQTPAAPTPKPTPAADGKSEKEVSFARAVLDFCKDLLAGLKNENRPLFVSFSACGLVLFFGAGARFIFDDVFTFVTFCGAAVGFVIVIFGLVWLSGHVRPAVPAGAMPAVTPQTVAGATLSRPRRRRTVRQPGGASRTLAWLAGSIAIAYLVIINLSNILGLFPSLQAALYERGFDRFLTPACILRVFKNCQEIRDELQPTSGDTILAPRPMKPLERTIIVGTEFRTASKTVRTDGVSQEPQAPTAPQTPESQRTPAVTRAAYQVFVQFAGSYPRALMIQAATALNALGWKVQGYERGGERTPVAAGKLEVRFGTESDKPAADQLVKDVGDLGIAAPLTSVLTSSIAPGTLEIWVSN